MNNILPMFLDLPFLILCVMMIIIVCTVWSWHHDKNNNFNLQQVLIDNTTGKIAIEKVGYMTALSMGTWGFIAITLDHKMSEWYAGLYIGVFAASRFGSSWLTVKQTPTTPPPDAGK